MHISEREEQGGKEHTQHVGDVLIKLAGPVLDLAEDDLAVLRPQETVKRL